MPTKPSFLCITASWATFLCCLLSTLAAEDKLNNRAVVQLVKAGLGDGVIVALVKAKPGLYDTSTEALIALKQEGVSDLVLKAIIERSSSETTKESVSKSSAPPNQNANLARNLAAVKTIHVAILGRDEEAGVIRAKLINDLSVAGPWTIIENPENADAVLTGSAVVRQGFAMNDGNGGTRYSATLAVRLLNREKQVLWTCQVHSRPPKRSLLSGGIVGWSASSSVAEQAAKRLLDARQAQLKSGQK